MLNNKEFDLWADEYDKTVSISDEKGTYPFAGYRKILRFIFQTVTETPNAAVLDIGFGTGTLTSRLYECGCSVYGQDFSSKMVALASAKCRTHICTKVIFQKGWSNRCKVTAMIILSQHTRCII